MQNHTEIINYFKSEIDNKYADELSMGKDMFGSAVMSKTGYSFLVFEGVELKYIDENGKKHKVKLK